MPNLAYDIAGDQIDGARNYQEDAFLITHLSGSEEDQHALVIVADGMGGHAAGNVASNMAVQAFNKHVSSNYPVDNYALIPDILKKSIITANDALKETISETAALKGMGCTMVGVLLAEGNIWWASVGDSHLYLVRDNKISKINADHSYGGFLDRMAAEGRHVEVDASLSRNMLMSALMGDAIAEIDVSERPFCLQPNDNLIISSDGLDTLEQDLIVKQVGLATDARSVATKLLKAVEEAKRPRQDNTTVISVRTALLETAASTTKVGYSDDDDDIDYRRRTPKSSSILTKLIMVVVVLGIAAVGADYTLKTGFIFPKSKAPVASTQPSKPATPTSDKAKPKPSEKTTLVQAPAKKPSAPKPAPHVVKPFTDKLKNGRSGPVMVTIPAGEFLMGASSLSTRLDERPQHKVTLKSFAISQYEITFAEYERYAKATGKRPPKRSGINPAVHPVTNVSWQDAQDYTSWLSRQTGHQYHLPTEAQWEYAARAKTTTDYWWGGTIGQGNAHCIGCKSPASPRKTAAIGSFQPNPWGLYDTSGNVSEWARDCYNSSYKGAPNNGLAWLDGDCSKRVVRGGSFSNAGSSTTNTRREKYPASTKLNHLGFRVVRIK